MSVRMNILIDFARKPLYTVCEAIMNKAVCTFILCITLSASSFLCAQTRVAEHQYQPGDPYYGIIEKEVSVFENEIRTSSVFYFTEEAVKKDGKISQSQMYENGKVKKYIIDFTDDYTKEWGIRLVEELVNESGEHEAVSYTFYDGTVYDFTGRGIEIIKKFIPRLILPLNRNPDFPKTADPENPVFYFDTRGIHGSTLVSSVKKIEKPVSAQEKLFLKRWMEHRQFDDLSGLYNTKVHVSENGVPIILFVQDAVLEGFLTQKKALISYYHLGALDNMPVNIMIGYY